MRLAARISRRRALGWAIFASLVAVAASATLASANLLSPEHGGSSLFVPTRIGMARATEMAMLGERIAAPQALEWGLINRVFSDDEFASASEQLLERLAAGPTRSYAGTKRQLNARVYAGIEDQLELEAQIQQEMAASGDFQEGVLAFLEKRGPNFTGA